LPTFIPRPVQFYPEALWMNKKIAEKFYMQARELQLSGQGGYKEWAYRKAAWALDALQESVTNIFRKQGISGLLEIEGVGKSLAVQVADLLKSV